MRGPQTAMVSGSVAVLLLLTLPIAGAQAQSVTGVLADSLFISGPIPNATVWVEGESREAQTDLSGRFSFDSLPPGSYALTFSHPAFDTAGVSPPRWRIQVPSEGLQDLVLAVPGADRRFAKVCAETPGRSSGYVIGSVRDAAGDTAMAGVTVDVRWTEHAKGQERDSTARHFTARTQTDAGGQFVLCPVPIRTELSLQASLNGAATGSLGLKLGEGRLAVRQLVISTRTLASARTGTDSAAVQALVRGTVRGLGGQAVAGARVSVAGAGTDVVSTDAAGAFKLRAPAGTQVLAVAAVGQGPGWRAVNLRPGENPAVELVLGRAVQTLASVEVVGRPAAASSLAAIEDRVRRNAGHLLTEREIVKRNPRRFEDILRGVPGLMVVPVPTSDGHDNMPGVEHAISSRGIRSLSEVACFPAYLVDGRPIEVERDNAPFPVPIAEIRAIEAYPSAATAPFEFQRAESGCGVIVVWTKSGEGE